MAQGASGDSKSGSGATDVLQVQHQIRANAAELQDYFSDLYAWEKTVAKEEAARKQTKAATALPKPRNVNHRQSPVVATVSNQDASPKAKSTKAADAHTYDKGYKKWEKFDVVRAHSHDI
ncbi:hypothetical protein PINS_up013182 [Pythium insidiosum]|nr:hypothetical protein PINS_up013182 [Pythium insidiosum]